MARRGTLIVVFAKAPQAGRVKTRLAPVLGAQGAARLHARLVKRALATALAADCGPVELHAASCARHDLFRMLARRHALVVRTQVRGDLGMRMHAALLDGLRLYRRAILIGSDCPALRPADLRRAARLLQGCAAVLAPAEDGGYPLIGLARSSPRLFEAMPWSTSAVLAETRRRLAGLGWRWRELRSVWDVDRPEDLVRLEASRLMRRRV